MVDILYSAALGLIAALIPVYLGLLPLPFFRRLSGSKRNLLLSFSIGILLFLFADVTGEGVELSKHVNYGSPLFAEVSVQESSFLSSLPQEDIM
jgi:hypothetical protein